MWRVVVVWRVVLVLLGTHWHTRQPASEMTSTSCSQALQTQLLGGHVGVLLVVVVLVVVVFVFLVVVVVVVVVSVVVVVVVVVVDFLRLVVVVVVVVISRVV